MDSKQSEAASSRGLIVDASISPNTSVDRDVAAAVSIDDAVSAAKRPAARVSKVTGTRSDDLQQKERKKRVAEMIAKELARAKPGVQTHELWSTEEQVHLRPGHH